MPIGIRIKYNCFVNVVTIWASIGLIWYPPDNGVLTGALLSEQSQTLESIE